MRIKAIAAAVTASTFMIFSAPTQASSVMAGNAAGPSTNIPITIQGEYAVELNKTQIIYLPEAASAVVVGNPDIADISVHSADTIFMVGRGFGETNFIVLNSAGHTIMNSNIKVSGSKSHNNVRIFKGGMVRTTYNCSPYCQPAPVLGDDTNFIAANKTRAKEITNTFATGSSITRAQIGSATEINPVEFEEGEDDFQDQRRPQNEN